MIGMEAAAAEAAIATTAEEATEAATERTTLTVIRGAAARQEKGFFPTAAEAEATEVTTEATAVTGEVGPAASETEGTQGTGRAAISEGTGKVDCYTHICYFTCGPAAVPHSHIDSLNALSPGYLRVSQMIAVVTVTDGEAEAAVAAAERTASASDKNDATASLQACPTWTHCNSTTLIAPNSNSLHAAPPPHQAQTAALDPLRAVSPTPSVTPGRERRTWPPKSPHSLWTRTPRTLQTLPVPSKAGSGVDRSAVVCFSVWWLGCY